MSLFDEWRIAVHASWTPRLHAAKRRDGVESLVIGIARAAVAGGYWQPDPTAPPAYILPVFDPWIPIGMPSPWFDEEPIDLVAWTPKTGFSRRTGEAWALNQDALDSTAILGDTAHLWSSPAAMMAAGYGSVVLDWGQAGRHLMRWPKVVADSLELGQQARDAIARAHRRYIPPLPEIAILSPSAIPGLTTAAPDAGT